METRAVPMLLVSIPFPKSAPRFRFRPFVSISFPFPFPDAWKRDGSKWRQQGNDTPHRTPPAEKSAFNTLLR